MRNCGLRGRGGARSRPGGAGADGGGAGGPRPRRSGNRDLGERGAGQPPPRDRRSDPRRAPADHRSERLWTLTFNGEVYNHLELRRDLNGAGWEGHSDSETLVRALAEWGEAALPRTNGPLALAALDRDRRRLLLARDRFAKKPLYIARADGAIWFASEIRALLAAGLRPRPDRAALAHTALHGWLNGPRTPLEGVERLGGGTLRSIDLASLATHDRTWFEATDQVDPSLAAELAQRPKAELTDQFDRLLGQAVERRLMSDVPVGTMLSGGLDSSLVTAVAARAGADLTAFTATMPAQPRADESRHAERAAKAVGVPLETVTIEPEEWLGHLVKAVWLYEYPLLSTGNVLIEPIAARARERGVKVLLTGEAADELLGGYDHTHPREMARFLPAPLAALRGLGALQRNGWRTVTNILRRRSLEPVPPGPFPREPVSERARGELVARAESAYGDHDRPRRRLEAELLADLSVSNFGHLLNRMDKNAMGASIETRLPFLDPDLTTLILNLPLERRVARTPKPILIEVAARYLPQEIFRRQKQMSMRYEVRELIESSVAPGALSDGVLRDTLEVPADVWADILKPRPWVSALWLWSAEIWARLFLERRGVAQVEQDLWG